MADGINGSGVPATEHYRNLSDTPPLPPSDDGEPLTVIVQEDAEDEVKNIGVERADGALIIRRDGKSLPRQPIENAKQHDANLAAFIDGPELGRICDELLNGIDTDVQSRRDWIDRRAAGIKHLALKIENPRSPGTDADTAVEGQATVRSPILLDAVMRFQANARGELLPAGGPVKIRNDSTIKTPARAALEQAAKMPRDETGDDRDVRAEMLETTFN